MKILIIGGVAGGASCAARLRRLNESAEIILFERGEYISFANCGLPYYIGDEITDKEALTLQTPESFNRRFNVDVRNFNEVVSIDRKNKKVTVKNIKTSETYDESYDKLVLSMGSKPIKPNIEGLNSNKVFTLRNIPDTYKIKNYINEHSPKNAVVVGGGYIGVEIAENLKNLNLDVTIVEMSNQVIAPIDFDMAQDVHNYIRTKGVNLILENGLKSVENKDNILKVNLNKGTLEADILIMAIGVRPESDLAKDCGLDINKRGCIMVDDHMVTSDADIYAIGDVADVTDFMTKEKSFIPLAGPANKQGRIVADQICGINSIYTGTQGSAIIKVFDMTVAATGINEKTCKRLGFDYDKSFTYSASHAGYYPGAVSMSIKTIFEKSTGKILGAQIVGFEGVDKRCDIFATAIRSGMTAVDLTELELCYAPPFSSAKDPVNMAGFVIENLLTGKSKNFHWHEVSDLLNRDDVVLLDTRTPLEYENGHIDGFKNIPLDDLRGRLNELDKNKKIYVTCQVGLRGYISCRILSENGYDAYNLSGGYRLYNSIFNSPKTINVENTDIESDTSKKKVTQ